MGAPNAFSYLMVAAFVVATFACFAFLPTRRAILVALVGGWMFLPAADANYDQVGLRSKVAFVAGVVAIASLLFDFAAWRRLRLRLVDLPVAVLSLVPFASAISNGLDLWEAMSATREAVTIFAVPYLVGRVYLGQADALRDLAKAISAGTFLYVPFVLFEVRMSPNLHVWIYGVALQAFQTTIRAGGYRPSVFMTGGLMLALFVASGTLVAYWLWRTGSVSEILRIPAAYVVAILLGTSVLLRSAGAQILLVAGVAALEMTRQLRSAALVLALLLAPPAYCAARIAGWGAAEIVQLSAATVGLERADSFEYRVHNENMLIAKAMERPVLGWGRWGRSRVFDASGRDISVVDGMWMIWLGTSGLVGLLALGLTLIVPPAMLLRRFPARTWSAPYVAPAAVLAVGLLLFAADSIPNAMLSPLFLVTAGALTSFVVIPARSRATGNTVRRSSRRASRASPSSTPGAPQASAV